MPKIYVNGIDLFYDVQGTGEALILIAGFDCDSEYWSAVMPALTNKYQVIRFDNRGAGQTSYLPTPQAVYHQSRAIIHHHTSDRIAQIICPTLVAVGTEDIVTPVIFSEQLADGIPNAELVVFERGGHGFLVEFPDDVVKVMLNFLAKH